MLDDSAGSGNGSSVKEWPGALLALVGALDEVEFPPAALAVAFDCAAAGLAGAAFLAGAALRSRAEMSETAKSRRTASYNVFIIINYNI